MPEIFSIKTAKDLYYEALEALNEYYHKPSERSFLFLAFILNHLREWCAECSYKDIQNKQVNDIPLNENERKYVEIYSLPEFKIVMHLCNNTKHFNVQKDFSFSKESSTGLICGLSRAGDFLGQSYFLIDGEDSREIFRKVLLFYKHWLNIPDT